jgi:hypothetical protein
VAKITREQAEKMTPKEAAYCEAEAVSYEADTIIRSKTILYLAGRGVIGMSFSEGGKLNFYLHEKYKGKSKKEVLKEATQES